MDDGVTVLVVGGPLHGARLQLSDPIPCLVLKPPSARSGHCTYVRCAEVDGHAVYAPPEMSIEHVTRLAQDEVTVVRSPSAHLGLWRGKRPQSLD